MVTPEYTEGSRAPPRVPQRNDAQGARATGKGGKGRVLATGRGALDEEMDGCNRPRADETCSSEVCTERERLKGPQAIGRVNDTMQGDESANMKAVEQPLQGEVRAPLTWRPWSPPSWKAHASSMAATTVQCSCLA